MPISHHLDGYKHDPETKRVIGLAFEMARAGLKGDWHDKADALLAKRIIDLAKARQRDPDILCEEALKSFRPQQR